MPTVMGPSGRGCRSHSCSEPSNRLTWRSSPNSRSMRSAVSCRWFRTDSALTKLPTGNTSFSKSAALANGIKDAHFVSRYSISGLVCPLSQLLIGRNIWGPSVWQSHRFHRGLCTSTRPNTVLTSWGVAGVLGRVPPAAVWTSTSSLQLFACLLGDYKILHACQQRFALGQIHAKRLHRQFPPLDRQDLPALFVALGV